MAGEVVTIRVIARFTRGSSIEANSKNLKFASMMKSNGRRPSFKLNATSTIQLIAGEDLALLLGHLGIKRTCGTYPETKVAP